MNSLTSDLFFLELVACAAPPPQAAPGGKAKFMILATGGTIAGAQTSATEVGYKSGSFSADNLIKTGPKLKDWPTSPGSRWPASEARS